MVYKVGNRMQQTFLPNSIEDCVAQDDSVRVYDAFVDALDFQQIHIPHLSFIWLLGGLTPAYRTIARFRDKYKEQIKNLFSGSSKACIGEKGRPSQK